MDMAIHTGQEGLVGIIGPCGPRGGDCPECGNSDMKYDSKTEVTSCPVCGWNNWPDVKKSLQERIAQGELPLRAVRKLNILGTEYKVTVKKYDEDEAFERRSIDSYCDNWTHQIVVCDMTTYKGWEHEPQETIVETQKEALRHEIVHAFLSESGLGDSALSPDCAWAKNEEMVDWFAIQGPKIFKAWQEAGAV